MVRYWDIAVRDFFGYATYLRHEVLNPHWGNYFYWLIALSLIVYGLELLFPWRKDQPAFRQDFWRDNFYMFFNFFLFSLIGFGVQDFILVHLFAILIGHLNHANFYLPLGPLRYLLNSPQMHIWHHAKELPENRKGVNYGLTLSVWDYLFGTVWMPRDERDIELGFPDIEQYPKSFLGQQVSTFFRKESRDAS